MSEVVVVPLGLKNVHMASYCSVLPMAERSGVCSDRLQEYESSHLQQQQERNGNHKELAGVEQNTKASSDDRPSKVSLVSGTTATGEILVIGRIREDSNEGGIKVIRLLG